MIDRLNVILWGTNIGSLFIKDNKIYFQYNKEFIKSNIQISPIHMKLNDTVYTFPNLPIDSFCGLPGLFSDSLPDRFGNQLLAAWYKKHGRSIEDSNALEKLSYIGSRGMGALEYVPAISNDNAQNEIEVSEMVEICNEILNKKSNLIYKDNLQELIKIGTSAGGARAKAIVLYNEATNEFKSGQIDNLNEGFDYYIIKFGGIKNNGDWGVRDPDYYTKIEYAYYLMAKDIGINISYSKLINIGGIYHFITKRFDRTIDKFGNVKKLHMQSLAAINHLNYNEPRTFSYEDTVKIMYMLNIGMDDVLELFKRMVFNVYSRNNDDHVKNISFLMDKTGKWRLSPAYDLTFAYKKNNMWLKKHQMLINGKAESFNIDDLITCGINMGLKLLEIKKTINKVKEIILRFEIYAKKAFLSDEEIKEIKASFELI